MWPTGCVIAASCASKSTRSASDRGVEAAMPEPASFALGAVRLAPWAQARLQRRPRPAGGASTGRQALTVFCVRSASAGLLYLSQVALARWMGAYDYGIYILVWTWVLVLGNLSNLGLSTAVLRLIPQHRARGEE